MTLAKFNKPILQVCLIFFLFGALTARVMPVAASGAATSGARLFAASAQGKQAPEQPPVEKQSPERTISPQEAKELFRSVDELLKFASDDTGLPIKHDIKRKLADREEVQSYLEKGMKDDKDAKRLERSSEVLKKFGLIPRDFQLGPFLVSMLKEQVAGYYDPKKKTVNILNWIDPDQQKPVLAHELTHALQDQSFGMEKWMKEAETEGDKKNDPTPADIDTDEESSAREAVVEGQAMVVMLDYSLASTGKTLLEMPQIGEAMKQGMLDGPDSPTFSKAPIFLKEELTFPYRYGMDFTLALEKAGGKKLGFEGAFNNPPTTTREIMEPDTYLGHEKIEPLKRIDFKKDFEKYDTFDIGAIGEFDVDVLVEQYAGRAEAEAMYPAWRGGYYFAGRPKGTKSGSLAVIYLSRWASADKASEFAADYARSLAKRYDKHQPLGPDGKVVEDAPPAESWKTLRGRHAWMTEEGAVVIEVRGDEVMVSESFDDETTKRVEGDFFGNEEKGQK
ncbi:MAG TPA: hypothetical protein VMT67_03895 [Terriglobales bacterium]|nr:hypothetical protein [Terriglobales bacterium]